MTFTLSRRQRDVARLAAHGAGTAEIARELHISYQAVKMHINAIADKLENPKLYGPLRLVRGWAMTQPALRD